MAAAQLATWLAQLPELELLAAPARQRLLPLAGRLLHATGAGVEQGSRAAAMALVSGLLARDPGLLAQVGGWGQLSHRMQFDVAAAWHPTVRRSLAALP